MKKTFKLMAACALAGLVLFAACKKEDDETADPTLYDRLGGITAIAAVVDQFLANVVADNTINGFLPPR